jgi:hypothetical protein
VECEVPRAGFSPSPGPMAVRSAPACRCSVEVELADRVVPQVAART